MTDEQPVVYRWADRHKRRTPTPADLQPITTNGHTSGGYGAAALNGEVETLLNTPQGGRNAQLNKSAFKLAQLIASGHLQQPDVDQALRAAALTTGLEPHEIDATLRSGQKAGVQQPRDVQPPQPPVTEISALQLAPGLAPTLDGDEATGTERSTWWPEPINTRAAKAAETPAPTHLIRDDQCALFYSGKVNGLIGESESGKSWVALLAVVQAANNNQMSLILDFEDSAGSIHTRLLAMGYDPEHLGRHVHYADPSESLGIAQSADLQEALTNQYSVIVIDGVNAAMTLLGYDLMSNTDGTLFATKFLRPLARTGACVITVDHVPKNPEARGKGGIGAQSKRAMQDGTCIAVEVIDPFGKGQSGVLKLTVDKDRNGAVRGISGGGRHAGKAHIDSVGDQVRLHIEAPDLRPPDERGTWRPTGVMEKVSRLLEDSTQPLSGREITDGVHSKSQTVRQAIVELLALGHIQAGKRAARGGGEVYHSVSEYRETPQTEVRPSASQVRPGRTTESASRVPSPYGEGRTSGRTSDTPPNLSASRTHLDQSDLSDCNRCGKPTTDTELDQYAGYCRRCGPVVNP